MKRCPCGSQHNLANCCGLYLEGKQIAETPEVLMRSRYTAYSLANIEYIMKTMRGKPLVNFNEENAKRWAMKAIWVGLHVLNASEMHENKGFVEFIAQFIEGSQLKSIHETSEFHCDKGVWFYVDGVQQPIRNVAISRNVACPCGSQRKFKNCHGHDAP